MATLEPWTNSWVDLEDVADFAEERIDLDSLVTYLDSNEDKVVAALIQAYRSINRLSFLVVGFGSTKAEPFRLSSLTETQQDLLPAEFLYDLKLAQVLEADSLLGLSSNSFEESVIAARRMGIIEHTVGQSTTRFSTLAGGESSSGPSLNKRTMDILSGYVYRGIRIGRA